VACPGRPTLWRAAPTRALAHARRRATPSRRRAHRLAGALFIFPHKLGSSPPHVLHFPHLGSLASPSSAPLPGVAYPHPPRWHLCPVRHARGARHVGGAWPVWLALLGSASVVPLVRWHGLQARQRDPGAQPLARAPHLPHGDDSKKKKASFAKKALVLF
jgi:hypothetical protein